jgi:hypothetical protein
MVLLAVRRGDRGPNRRMRLQVHLPLESVDEDEIEEVEKPAVHVVSALAEVG